MQNTIALVSLSAIRRNAVRLLRAAGGTPLIAVVKDDAYGHGAVQVALAIEDMVAAFAVCNVAEGAALRLGGVTRDILVLLPPVTEEEAARAALYGFVVTVSSPYSARLLCRAARQRGVSFRAHLAVNTGMNRIGFRPERVATACRRLEGSPVCIEGIFSHFYAAEDASAREAQTALFRRACADAGRVYPHLIRHLAATGGILAGAGLQFDAVRPGIGLYGYLPVPFQGALPLFPAMKVYAPVVQSGKFTGGGIGYARATRAYGSVSAVRAGYGDGLFRRGLFGAEGNLCMDAHVREGGLRAGRYVCVLDDAAAYAEAHGTIAYEVLCRVGEAAERRYV